MVQPDRSGIDAYYPVRIAFRDAFQVNVTLDFVIQVCKTLAPVRVTASMLTIADPAAAGLSVAPIFVAVGNDGSHYPAPKRFLCRSGEPCQLVVAAVVYDSSIGQPLRRYGYCEWGPPLGAGAGGDSRRCADAVRQLGPLDQLHIDATHAATRAAACGGTLYYGGGRAPANPAALNTPRCHSVSAQVVGGDYVARVNVSVLGGRPGFPKPYEFDIGRKIVLCFQARQCSTCCYSSPYCVTVEILGHGPRFDRPAAGAACPTADFASDRLTAAGLVDTTRLPSVAAFAAGCPALPLCWGPRAAASDPTSPASPPPAGRASQYGGTAAAARLRFRASDGDSGETVTVGGLWGPVQAEYYPASSLSRVDPALAVAPAATAYASGATCPVPALEAASAAASSAGLWQTDSRCATGEWELAVAAGFGDNGAAGWFSPLRTANVPEIDPDPPPWGGVNEDGYYFAQLAPDKTLCVAATDNQAAKWGRGLNNSQVRCHTVRFRGPPTFIAHRYRAMDSPFAGLDARRLGAGTGVVPARVGLTVQFTVRARDPNPEDTVAILLLEDPGTPPALELGPLQCVLHGLVASGTAVAEAAGGGPAAGNVTSLCAEAYRTARWTPRAGDEGRPRRACFVPRDDRSYCASWSSDATSAAARAAAAAAGVNVSGNGGGLALASAGAAGDSEATGVSSPAGPRATSQGYFGYTQCVDINVSFARPAWDLDGTEAAAARQAGTELERSAYVGCAMRSAAAAWDAAGYDTLIWVDPDAGGLVAPTIAATVATTATGNSGELARIAVALAPRSPPGLGLVVVSTGNMTRVELRWVPPRGTEGFIWRVCLRAGPTPVGVYGSPQLADGSAALPPLCLRVAVRRCRYCVGPGETLLAMAQRLAPEASWLLLWAANGNDDGQNDTAIMIDPDYLFSPPDTASANTTNADVPAQPQVVNLGPLYVARPGETLAGLAARFRTTVRRLLDLNPDLAAASAATAAAAGVAATGNPDLSPGQELCFTPCAL